MRFSLPEVQRRIVTSINYAYVSNSYKKEQVKMLVFLSTTPEIQGKRIIEQKGIVFGDTVFTISVESLFSDFSLAGRNRISMESALADAKKRSMDLMINNASQIGANAIIGVKVDFEFGGQKTYFVSAYGTAVVVE